ncbi:MAG: SsrA-binding protein SmpB [Planctomycetaceae bacterium]|jgi:SsrA-binding protein|nr:SsrA-binding protein SmpB [Planctomycetaceae bacterium]
MSDRNKDREPVIENRKARHDFAISDTLECGIELVGTEVKSLRLGQASLAEGWIKAEIKPAELTLLNVTIAEYPPAGATRQHVPNRPRRLLAHAREIVKFGTEAKAKGATLVPLKIYWVKGRAKLLLGIGTGKKQHDKREDIAKRQDKRDIDRAMSRRR